MAKLVISHSERMQLIGLLSVGAQLLHQLNTVEQAMCQLLAVEPDDSGYSGHVGDTLYEADTRNPVSSVTHLLARLGVLVDVEPEDDAPTPTLESLPHSVRTDLPRPTTTGEEPPF